MLKNWTKKICILLTAAIAFIAPVFAEIDYRVELQPQVLEKVVQIEQKGILKQRDNGYLYLEVSDNFIAEAIPLIVAPGKIIPPRHYTSKKGIGAHISVMDENEVISNEIWEIQEVGQEFTFKVMELRTVKLNRENKMKKLWLLVVDAPQLEELRKSYGLSPDSKTTISTSRSARKPGPSRWCRYLTLIPRNQRRLEVKS